MAKDIGITLDELTKMTANGFVSVTQRIMTVDSKVDRLEHHVKTIDTRLERIENTMLELA